MIPVRDDLYRAPPLGDRKRSPAGALVIFAVRRGRGGAYRDRTDDLLNANQALSQLS